MGDPNAPALDTERLIDVLAAHGVEYVIVGGIAALVHGSQNATFDFDLVPATTADNLEALASALTALGAKLRLEDGSTFDATVDAALLANMELSTWRTDAGDVDIIRGIPTAEGLSSLRFYPELREAGETFEIFDTTVQVASLAMIIESKEGANREVDLLALRSLRTLQQQTATDLDFGI